MKGMWKNIMIIKYVVAGLFGIVIGMLLMGIIFTSGNTYENAYDVNRAFRDGYEKGRKEISNETETESKV